MAQGTHAAPQETAVRTNVLVRALIYTVLIVFAVYYLLPLYVMRYRGQSRARRRHPSAHVIAADRRWPVWRAPRF